jgi:hypothetical protein
MSADSNALRTVQSLPGLTPPEQQYLLTVARGEGFYGLGWGNPSAKTIAESEQFGIDPRAGVGSNNWGAEQGTGSAGSFPHIDHHADGSAYVGKFKKHLTPTEGAASVARVLLKPNVKAAVNAGDIKAAVEAQHANGYFELAVEEYLKAVKRNYDALTKNLNWPALLSGIKGTIANPPLVSPGSLSSESQSPYSGELSLSHRPVLRLGSSDHGDISGPVHILQSHLPGVVVDGEFGRLTDFAVRAFQMSRWLIIDGVVGPKTWNEIGRVRDVS